MNRSWFRNPFAARQDADDEDEPALDDSGVLSSGSNGHGKSSSTGNRRRRKRSNKDSSGERAGMRRRQPADAGILLD